MIRVSSLLFWFSLALVSSLVLYGTSNRVQDLGKNLRALNAQIEAEQANIHVLKAEWVYLASPARIEAAARKYLAMHPTALKQIAKLENLPELLPTQAEAMGGVTVKSVPLASVGTTLAAPTATVASRTDKSSAAHDTAHINTHMVIQPSQNAAAKTAAAAFEDPMLMADGYAHSPAGPVQ